MNTNPINDWNQEDDSNYEVYVPGADSSNEDATSNTEDESEAVVEGEDPDYEFFVPGSDEVADAPADVKDTKDISSTINSAHVKLAKDLAQLGVLDINDDVEINNEEDVLFHVKNTIMSKAKGLLNEFTENLDPLAKQFIEYKRQGGDTKTFLEKFSSFDQDVKVETIEDKIRFLTNAYREKGLRDSIINATIQKLDDDGDLESEFEAEYNDYSERKSRLLEDEVRQQEQLVVQRQKEFQEEVNNIQTLLSSKKEISGLPITKKDREELIPFLYQQIETESGHTTTSFKTTLSNIIKNPEQLIVLAKLVRENMDLSSLKKVVKSEQVGNVRSGTPSLFGNYSKK